MKKAFIALLVIAGIAGIVSCDESSTVGNVLDSESVVIVIDSNFTIKGISEASPVVQSRTISQLLGTIEAPVYGSISSSVVAQFMSSLSIDTTGVRAADIDSVKLFMQMLDNAFVGDSLVPMEVSVYRLTRDLPYPIYSDFDPTGYYNPTAIGHAVYTASERNEPDSIANRTSKAVTVDLPLSLGRELFEAYMADPSAYATPDAFVDRVFKGLYFTTTYGSGRICDFTTTSMRLYYHKREYNADSARYEVNDYVGDYYAVTPEVIVNNNINYSPAAELQAMVAGGDHVIAAPAGYQVELEFPAREVLASYNRYSTSRRVLNSLTLEVPVDSIDNPYAIAPPPYALLILKSELQEFISSNSVPDNVTGFYTAYNATTGAYTFNAMRGYLNHLLALGRELTPDDYTFVLCPVQTVTESAAGGNNYYYGTGSSTIVTAIVPYVSKPAMGKISLDDAKIKLSFSAETGKN